jgi:hypothetical protein
MGMHLQVLGSTGNRVDEGEMDRCGEVGDGGALGTITPKSVPCISISLVRTPEGYKVSSFCWPAV